MAVAVVDQIDCLIVGAAVDSQLYLAALQSVRILDEYFIGR